MRVACIGEAMVELSLDTARSGHARVGFAGDTLNTAIYLKRQSPGLEVAYVTRLGIDRFSDDMLAFMAGEGLDTSLVGRDDERLPGLYAIATDASGERSFSYWRANSAARQLFSGPAPALQTLGAFNMIYLSAISLAILSSATRAALTDWLVAYRSHGGLVAFDSNYRPSLWRDRATAAEAVEALWRQTDVALPSLDDEMALFGDADEASVRARILGYGVRVGALKRGAAGPIALDGSPAGPFPAATRVVDSTAAGDSFNAAYLAARIEGRSEAECLVAGHALAVEVIGSPGAILPRKAEETA